MSDRPLLPRKPLRIVLGSTRFPFISAGQGIAPAFLELGAAAFFAAGIAQREVGSAAPWVLLGTVLLGMALRGIDLEGCSLFIPGGLYGSAREAFGPTAGVAAASAQLVEQLLFGALAASAAGHYTATLTGFVPGAQLVDFSTAVAVFLVAATWWVERQGHALSPTLVRRSVSVALGVLATVVAASLVTVVSRSGLPGLVVPSWSGPYLRSPLTLVQSLGYCLFAAAGVEALAHVAPEFPRPQIRHLHRAGRLIGLYSLVAVVVGGFSFVVLVPADAHAWRDASIAALAYYSGGPTWVRVALVLASVGASVVFLTLSAQRAVVAVQHLLSRLSYDGVVTPAIRALHPRLGTPSRLIDISVAGQLTVIVLSGGQLPGLARTYAVGIVVSALLKIAVLIRLRRQRPGPRAFRIPVNVRRGGRELPLGLIVIAALVGVPAVVLLAVGDPPTLGGSALVLALAGMLTTSARRMPRAAAVPREIELQTTPSLGPGDIDVRAGNILVAIRKPYFLAHLTAALQATDNRDIVVMTVRIGGIDVAGDLLLQPSPTDDERRLFDAAVSIAERHGRAVRLLIVPATNVFDAVVESLLRLQSSEIYVGESDTLSADDQARLLGEAWERASKPEATDVRMVVHHSSGRTAVYHLGAHPPRLSADDLQLIHKLWLDLTKSIGPQVHHHDVVRAALTHMADQLNSTGPQRDAALDLVRQVSRPADELAEAVHQRDFAGLRDKVRNRPPSDLAGMLTDLTLEDQVVIFRVLPREVAAATFEYLSQEAQEALLKAMALEDVAALLNNMAPDDRTMFLEELPASATQQLLALLSPEERAVANALLGYPEGSIGRLMTPDYIAVREHWTVQEVLDFVREHGRDSETLNMVYVVDDRGTLIDDIRMREFLLTSPATRVANLMDRRFIALNAADKQDTAVGIFRREDRSALPVTDSVGILIGIVTIDDVLDVAEAAATKEIQRIGGSEALDEPYMRITFGRMIQKRAGWLTALFLGEMLTATAMGAFEREIERAVVLALFVPLIISSGGNSGSQASTLVIRAIALGEVQLKDWWRVMRREIAAGLALGSILGSIGFLRITVWSAFSNLYGAHWLLVALTVATALIGVVLWGTLVGSLLPFLLRRLGFDPATSSAPFVATLVDVTGLVIYFSVGLVILRGTLL